MEQMSQHPDREHRFRQIYRDLYSELLRFVQRRTEGPHTGSGVAEDVVAETFLAVWRRLDDLPVGRDAARAWVFGIARNTLLNSRRGARRRGALGVRLADAERVRAARAGSTNSGVAPGTIDVDLQVDLERAWRQLSATHQEALALAVLDGLDSSQAAVVLDISATAFRLRLSRARRELRALLRTDDPLPYTERL